MGGLQVVVLSFEFHQNLLSGFGAVGGGRNLPFLIDLAIGLYNSLYYRTSRDIEFVEKWPHLGHMISSNLSDDVDINYRKQSLIGQINSPWIAWI